MRSTNVPNDSIPFYHYAQKAQRHIDILFLIP
jgi:hypothetical protein